MNRTQKVISAVSGLVGLAAATVGATIFIKDVEGVRYETYPDVGGVLTACYGHTGKELFPGQKFTPEECDELLSIDLEKKLNYVMKRLPKDTPALVIAAMASFVYNVGEGNANKATVFKMLQRGETIKACDALLAWKYVGKRDCSIRSNGCYGVWDRRQSERELCYAGFGQTIPK